MDLLVEPGTLLCASPDLLDPNFMHSVVLMCRHSSEGAYGLTVNRPSGHGSQEVLSEHAAIAALDLPIFLGGPVGTNQLQVLHAAGEEIDGGVPVVEGVWLGADLDEVAAWVQAGGAAARQRVRLVVGYSGWAEGQLDGELAGGSWLPAAGSAEYVFAENGPALWRRVVRSIGPAAHGLESEPPDPTWN